MDLTIRYEILIREANQLRDKLRLVCNTMNSRCIDTARGEPLGTLTMMLSDVLLGIEKELKKLEST